MTTTNQHTLSINGKLCLVNDILKGFQIYDRKSSMIAYIGTNVASSELFIQFNNGKGFSYAEVPAKVLAEAIIAPSIGKFFHANIKDKFTATEVESDCITPAPVEDVFDELPE